MARRSTPSPSRIVPLALLVAGAAAAAAPAVSAEVRTPIAGSFSWAAHDGAAVMGSSSSANTPAKTTGPDPFSVSVLDPGATVPRPLVRFTDRDVTDLGVGSDAQGAAVALVLTRYPDSAYAVPFAGGPPALLSGPHTTRVALHRGRLAFATRSHGRDRVYVRAASGGVARERFAMPKRWSVGALEIGRDDVVFVQGSKTFGPNDRARDDRQIVWRSDARGHARRLLVRNGVGTYRGLGPGTITQDGTVYAISKWSTRTRSVNEQLSYDVASGRLLGRRPAPTIAGADAVSEVALDDRRSLVGVEGPLRGPCPVAGACTGTTLIER